MKIEDIARQAHVSKAAVSLALNNRPGISEETRNRILGFVKESGYKHRSMVQDVPATKPVEDKLIRLVGCIKEDLVSHQYQSSSFFSDIIHTIERQVRRNGLLLTFSYLEGGDFKEELERLEEEHPSSGILLLGTNLSEEEISSITEANKRCVVIDTLHDHVDADFVVMDNAMGGHDGAIHLMEELGHDSLGYAASESRLTNFTYREKGFMEALATRGRAIKSAHRYSLPSDIATARERFGAGLDRGADLPGAIFCECDYIAIGIIQALKERGIRVPEDVSVMGFDDVPEASILEPALTSIAVPRERIAELAVMHLLQLKTQQSPLYAKTLVNTSLVRRASCRPARSLP